MPSVTTLYAIVSALELSMDQLFVHGDESEAPAHLAGAAHPSVVKASERDALRLGSGVRWERLSGDPDHRAEFNFLVYEPGGASSDDGALVRHPGVEYGMVISGRLSVQLGFDVYELCPGDSISFESWTPHRLATIGDEPAHAIWVVVDRAPAGQAATVAARDGSFDPADTARALLHRS